MRKPLLFLSPLHRATRQIGIWLGGRMTAMDLQGTEGHLLSFLRSYEPAAVTEIARIFGTKKSTLTGLLDRLEKRGLLRRELRGDDRRSFLVRLTPKGRRLADRVQEPVDELEREIRRHVTEEELKGFHAVLDGIAKATNVDVRTRGES
ncbi:MarR family transcriptional regulator [bacterium]|nr:MarR family transcriptional regulator [bacterium]